MGALIRHRLGSPKGVEWADGVLEPRGLYGEPKTVLKKHINTPADVDEAMLWLSAGADFENGRWEDGGRRAQSAKAAWAAGIVAHELGVIHAERIKPKEPAP